MTLFISFSQKVKYPFHISTEPLKITDCVLNQQKLLHCVKGVRIRSFFGPYFRAFGLNTERKGVYEPEKLRIRTRIRINSVDYWSSIFKWFRLRAWFTFSGVKVKTFYKAEENLPIAIKLSKGIHCQDCQLELG